MKNRIAAACLVGFLITIGSLWVVAPVRADRSSGGDPLITGRPGGRVVIGGSDNGDPLTLRATSGTDGPIISETSPGTERMRILSTGEVGIGTPTPNDLLHLADGNDTALSLQRTTTTVGDSTGLQFKVSTDTSDGFYNAGIFFERTNEEFSSGGKLHFAMDATGAGNVVVADAKMTILQGGNVGFGTPTPDLPLDIAATTTSMQQTRWATAAGSGAGIAIRRSRGAAVDDDTVVVDGDSIAVLNFMGYDGATFTSAAQIQALVDGAPGVGDMPGRLVFLVTIDGAAAPTERMRITNVGNVGIDTSGPDRKLDILDAANPQLRLTNVDGTTFADFQVDANHDLLVKPSSTGQVKLQPTTDSIDFFQVLDADGGNAILNVDAVNERVGIANSGGPQYRLDVGNLSYFAINGNFAHIVQHNSAAATFWSIAPRNGGDLDIAVTTTDPRPSSGTIGTSDNAISIKANKDVEFLGDVELAMGTGTGRATALGTANVNTTAVGNVGGGEDDLMTFVLPANSLSADGKGVRVSTWGTTAGNGNTKTIKLFFGTASVRQIGPTAANAQDWRMEAIIIRTGATAQDAIGTEMVNDTNVFNTHSEPSENTAAAITIKVTGQSAASATNDIVQEGMLIEFLN